MQKLDEKKINKIINSLYKEYTYLGISEYRLKKYIESILPDMLVYYNENNIDIFKSRIKMNLNSWVRTLLLNDDLACRIIKNYTGNLKLLDNNYIEAKKYINNIKFFCDKYNYFPNPDTIIELITDNSILNLSLKIIVNNDIDRIKSVGIENLYNNSIISAFISSYILLNNIYNEPIGDIDNLFEYTNIKQFYIQEIKENPLLTEEEEKKLGYRILKGDMEAREILIKSNLLLVISIANKYHCKGLTILDLIQEGNVGLIIAADKFDVTKNYRFSSYATCWIKSTITRAIASKSRNLKVPNNVFEDIGTLNKTKMLLEKEYGREVTNIEISNKMGISLEKVMELNHLKSDTISIHATYDEDNTLEDILVSPHESTDNVVINNILSEQVQKIFQECNLTSREIDILTTRYEIDNKKCQTQEELSMKYNLTKERIRQIEITALIKIRRSEYIKKLVDYMDYPELSLKTIEIFNDKCKETKNRYRTTLIDDIRTDLVKQKIKRSR